MPNLKERIGPSLARRFTATVAIVLGSCAVAVWITSSVVRAAPATTRASVPDASGMVRLFGHVNGRARPQFDIGAAPDSLVMNGLEIVFAKTPAQERALEQLIAAQQDSKSPEYHKWLTPADYGARFGASPANVAAVTRWLEAGGFTVDALPANRSQLRFHGSKPQVEAALHTQIHLFEVDGVRHFSNVSDPAVPAEIAPAIMLIRGLDDFYPKSTVKRRAAHGSARPQITYDAGQQNFVGPGDFAVMYNLTPLYNAGVNGSGVTIAVPEQSDIDTTVVDAFWAGVGIAVPPTVTATTIPGGTDPGQTMDQNETEAYLDVEVAGGIAPGATILLVADTSAVNAFQYIIQQKLASVLSISFESCESSNTSGGNSFLSTLFEEAAAQGMTVVVGSGDAGVAGCEANIGTQGTLATTGFAVNGLASTPYNLAVGGTDFDLTRAGDWGTSNAPGTLSNALAHIPEMVWNDTCANPLFAQVLNTTTSAFCNQAMLNGQPNPFLDVSGSGGGVSSCLSVDTNTNACTGGYAVPAWQSGVAGIANLTGRAVPDVAVIANEWAICSYDDVPCDPTNQNGVDIVGGTSSSAPAVAAIIALLDQQMGGSQGLVNAQLYRLAAAEFGTPAAPNAAAAANCSASLGTTIGANCVFYDVTAGSNATPCTVASFSDTSSAPASTCNATGGQANGIMELNSTPQYLAGNGFNLAAGLGSINATNLVLAIYLPAPTGVTATPNGQSVMLSWTADAHAANYNVYQATQSGQEGATPVQSAVSGTSTTISGLQFAQTYYFTIAATAALGSSAQSTEAQATIVPAAPTGLTATAANASATLTWTASNGATGYNVYQGTSAGGEAAAAVQSNLSGLTATVSGLTNGTTYYFKVAAVDAGGASPPSNEAQATPVAPASHGGGALGPLDLLLLSLLAVLAAAGRVGALARRPESSGLRESPAHDI